MKKDAKFPPGIFPRGNRLWMQVKGREGWKNLKSPFTVEDDPTGEQAAAHRATVQGKVNAGKALADANGGPLTLKQFGEQWMLWRRGLTDKSGNPIKLEEQQPKIATWEDDESRLKTWIYPVLGTVRLIEITPQKVAEVIDAAQRKLASRTIRNVYSVMQAMFRDARIRGLVKESPCILTKHDLGHVHDKNPEWRAGAIFTATEFVSLISDHKIPLDRKTLYGLLGFGALRHGEGASLRWRHLTKLEPLGRLVIANSNEATHTKTGVERWMPVHPTLAAMLAEWRLSGWPMEFGRAPGPDDLIVPHTKATNRGPRVEFGGMRSDHDSYKRLMSDCKALGIRHRRVHDFRRTGITLYRDAGAERDILRRCTHKPSRDVMEQYTTFEWARLCAQIVSLKLQRATPAKEAVG